MLNVWSDSDIQGKVYMILTEEGACEDSVRGGKVFKWNDYSLVHFKIPNLYVPFKFYIKLKAYKFYFEVRYAIYFVNPTKLVTSRYSLKNQ